MFPETLVEKHLAVSLIQKLHTSQKPMVNHVKPSRHRAIQDRTQKMQRQIAEGAIRVLSTSGVAGLTHRAVAKEARVSLAATTRHYSGKIDILAEASRLLLSEYLDSFKSLQARLRQNPERSIETLDDLVVQVTVNALCRDRDRSLAWWEIMLFSGRSPEGQALARDWFVKLDAIWLSLAEELAGHPDPRQIRISIERALGMIFLLHPLELGREAVESLFADTDIHRYLDHATTDDFDAENDDTKKAKMRERLVETGVRILIDEGPDALSYRAAADRVGMVRSGPSYYFASVNALIEAAQLSLFARAKQRYRTGFQNRTHRCGTASELAKLTGTIFLSEAGAFHMENLAYFSVWIAAARSPGLRGFVQRILLDQSAGWTRRVREIHEGDAPPGLALKMQSVYAGKLARALAVGATRMDPHVTSLDFLAAARLSGN